MNRIIGLVACVLVLAVFGACGGGDRNEPSTVTAHQTSGLASVGVLPIPCAGYQWTGSAVDLMAADAVTACSGNPSTKGDENPTYLPYGGGPLRDGYLTYIRGRMEETVSGNGQTQVPQVIPAWAEFRKDATKNCDPVTGDKTEAAITPRFIDETINAFYLDPARSRKANANLQLRSPAFSLCIAQTLRDMVPGSAGGEALLLSEPDQRMLLETIRERAQMAMLDYAALGVAFAAHYVEPSSTNAQRFLPDLQYWALTAAGTESEPGYYESDTLKAMGADFAAAVQLHITVSEELTALLSRSRSARTPRGGDADSRAEEVWGAGSFHERLLAAMMGGDPLANGVDSPWERPTTSVFPSDTSYTPAFLFDRPGSPVAAARGDGWDWPDEDRAPFIRTSLAEPQVHELLRLARRFDRVLLVVSKGTSFICQGFDLDASADDIYRWVEANLRAQDCQATDPDTGACCITDACVTQLLPQQPFADEQYLLWERFRISPDHAKTLVKYLAENLDYKRMGLLPKDDVTGTFCQLLVPDPDVRAGGQFTVGKVWFQPAPVGAHYWLRLSPIAGAFDAGFADRTLADMGPAYTRNAVVRFPLPWDLKVLAPAHLQGYLGVCARLPSSPACPEPALEAKRLMGVGGSLAATRSMLMSSLATGKGYSSQVDERARLNDYFIRAPEILRLIDGAIGPASVAVRPRLVANTYGTNVFVQTVNGEPAWEVEGTFSAQDSAGFWSGEGSDYEVCAVPHPLAGNLVTQHALLGDTSIADLLAKPSTRCTGVFFWSQFGPGWEDLPTSYEGAPNGWITGALKLPTTTDQSFTLVAVRNPSGEAADRAYLLLGSSFAVHDPMYLRQGQYMASGGVLGDAATKSLQRRRDDPSEPKYDGFGLPTDWVPPFNAELIGGTPGQTSVDRYLELAKSAAQEATAAVNQAMDQLTTEEGDQQAMEAATQRWQQGVEEEQEKLCGPANPNCTIEMPAAAPLDAAWFAHYRSFVGSCPDEKPTQLAAVCRSTYDMDIQLCDLNQTTCHAVCEVDGLHDCTIQAPANAGVLACQTDIDCIGDAACMQQCIDSFIASCRVVYNASCKSACDEDRLACGTDAEVKAASCETAKGQLFLDCFAARVQTSTLGMEVSIAPPVLEKVSLPQQPTFNDYAGGSLQTAFIEQWSALRSIDTQLELLWLAVDDAKGRLAVANAIWRSTYLNEMFQCDPARMQEAHAAALSVGCSGGDFNTGDFLGQNGFHCTGDQAASINYNAGPMIAQANACAQAMINSPANEAAQMQAFIDALQSTGTATSGIALAQADLAKSSATIAQLANASRLATARLDLEKKLADTGLKTSFGMYRRYRSYDVWRAKAWVENARRYALAARRALDARYVVDLSMLSRSEAFVQSPSMWADQVYDYDLSLPAAVGMTVTPGASGQQGGVVYPNKIQDYVSNLEGFMMGYAATRPSAVSQQDVEVVNLRGLKTGDGVDVDGVTVYGSAGEWMVRCPGKSELSDWIPLPRDRPASEACVIEDLPASPERARMSFVLDPWGRLNGAIADEPYQRRFNGRWGLVAVNFVGTGVKSCENAADPYACYSEGFIRYDLSHIGPASITDYDGVWHTLGFPIGRIEAAKGLASELWLDPLKDGWNTPYISAVARTEFQLRPLGGAYDLEFEITPEIDIDQIERVQLLIGSTYWVKQD